jgi:glycosyltransferase involved in cell wall biosynthesis
MENTIILTVHNKEKTIKRILKNLFKNTSSISVKIIIILDGCTDKTYKKVKEFIKSKKEFLKVQIISTNDIWETKANNLGLKEVKTDYATIVQDDMLIKQKNWDKTLINNFKKYDLFAVSGRAAHDFRFINDKFEVVNIFGREYPFSSRNFFGRFVAKIIRIFKLYWIYKYFNFFSKRLVVNRGPLMLKMSKAKKLNFFDEKFAPFELDDIDLCCRAFKTFGLLSGANPIYYIELNGSKKNNLISQNMSKKCILKNTKILLNRHKDLVN